MADLMEIVTSNPKALSTSRTQSKHSFSSSRSEPKASTAVHYLYPELARFLSTRGMVDLYDVVYPYVLKSASSSNNYLSPPALLALCETLPLPDPVKAALIAALRTHCVDEQMLVDMEERQLIPYFSPNMLPALTLLRAVVMAHAGYWHSGPISCPPGRHPMACAGFATDLTLLSEAQAQAVIAADDRAASTGEGLVYGQLLVLGYAEKHRLNHNSFDVGSANNTLALRRRAVAGYLHHTTGQDPLHDVFQIGRANANDLVLRGNLHLTTKAAGDGSSSRPSGGLCGPLSRFACRIVCDRLPPFAARCFAAGADESGELVLGGAAPKVPTSSPDWVTTCGLRLWRPDAHCWVEVSVGGLAISPRESLIQAGGPIPNPNMLFDGTAPGPDWRWNKLCNGCILDIAGTYVLYQSAAAMASTVFTKPAEVLHKLHELRPTCPVLLTGIKFSHQTAAERRVAQQRATEASGLSYVCQTGLPRIPIGAVPVFGGSAAEDHVRAMVYPACGHVHGYSTRLAETHRCPLCRQHGVLTDRRVVPLLCVH
jgi:hypothetical protein